MLLLALCVAVLSLTAVGFFTNRISQGVRAQAAEVLAADLRLESPTPFPAAYFTKAGRWGSPSAQLPLVSHGDFQRRGESARGAQRGDRRLSRCAATCASPTRPSAPRASPTGSRRRGEAWVDARIMAQLEFESAEIRDRRRLVQGDGVLDYRPDQGTGFVNLAPAVLLNYDDVASTELIQPGSRVTYAACSPALPAAVAEFRDYLQAAKAARRAPARGRRVQPAAEFSDRPCEPVPESRQPRLGAACRRRGRDGRTPLCGAAPRCGRVDEMHGRLAALRARDLRHRAHPARPIGRGHRFAPRVWGAMGARVAVAGSGTHVTARRLARAGRGRAGDGQCDARGVRLARAPASQEHAAGARACGGQ